MLKRVYFLLLFIFFTFSGISQESYNWHREESENFYIYYRNAPLDYIKKVKKLAESYYWKLENKLGLLHLQFHTKIYIYDNKEDYLKFTHRPAWSSGCAYLEEKTIKSFFNSKDFLTRVLPHELGHIMFDEYLAGRKVPLFLHEGIAQFCEKSLRRNKFKYIIKKALRGKMFIPLGKLVKIEGSYLAKNPQEVSIFYAESIGIIDYLLEKHGKFNFRSFLREIKEGSDLEKAIKWAFGYDSIEELNKEWVEYLSK